MAAIKALFDKGEGGIAQAFGTPDITSTEMQEAIRGWIAEYYRRTPDRDSDPCQRLPYTIVHKLEKGMFAEYESTIQDADGDKGAWMAENLAQLNRVRGEAIQWMLIGGECWLKPVPFRRDGKAAFRPHLIRRDQAAVLGRGPDGAVTGIGTGEHTARGGSFYTLLEKRTVDESGRLAIENRLYCSRDGGQLGAPCALSALPQYKELPQAVTLPQPVGGVGLVPLRTPLANCVDGSREAVSIYEPAMGLIHNINRNEALLKDEYELGRHRIVAPAEMLQVMDGEGRRRELRDNVFVGVEEYRAQGTGLTAFSPALRHEAYEARKQTYLKSIENVIGMKRGLLSDVQEVEKTAYEIASTAGDYNLSLIDLQRIWFDAVREYLTLCDRLGQLYRYCDGSAWDVREKLSVTWGNGVLYDPDRQWQEDCEMVRMGYLKPEIALARKYDLPWETEADLAAVRAKYMPEADDLTETERLR